MSIPGIERMDASRVVAAIKLGKKVATAANIQNATKIGNPRDAFTHLVPSMQNLEHEEFRVILLDAKNFIIGSETVYRGTISSSISHPREIFKLTLRRNAAAIIVAHNHPSGDPSPSEADRAATKRIAESGNLLGIHVVDHIIVGNGKYYSFREDGREEGLV